MFTHPLLCKLQQVKKKLGWDITSPLFGPQPAWKKTRGKAALIDMAAFA